MHPQICGYLEPKHTEQRKHSLASPLFSRRKTKREWIVLDEEGMQLSAFQDEESANSPKRHPIYSVPLVNATFSIDPSIERAFSIVSNRKYTYQAETNNAMMTWIKCLQACRGSQSVDMRRNTDDTLENSQARPLTLPPPSQNSSDNYLLRNFSQTYSFTSSKSGALKTRSFAEDDTESSNSPPTVSPRTDSVYFFNSDVTPNLGSGSSSPVKSNPTDPDNASLSETGEVNQFLKFELLQTSDKVEKLRKLNETLASELQDLQIGYASLLQSCYSYKLDGSMGNGEKPDLRIDSKHKERVGKLLQRARRDDPRLPSLAFITSHTGHTDAYGFQQSFENEEPTMLYITSRLLGAYSMRSSEEESKIMQWTKLLESDFKSIPRRRLKELCRRGIPGEMREQIWTKLIETAVEKIRLEKGAHYYQSLVDQVNDGQVKTTYRRQITLDMLRTFPNHIAFNRPEGYGVQKMQEVIQAFTLHNPAVGYCQGMNFIVGNASLFLDKETTFWLLVLIVEHFFPPNYFNAGLISAQADQIILRDLLNKYCPKLAETMQNLDVDIATITFNWFIAVFVNSVPIETLLRIWDVFLLEGEKIIFRVAIALLMGQEDVLIQQSDTLAFWKCIKTAVGIVYDHEELLKTAFGGFKMIKRKELKSRREKEIRDIEKRLQEGCFSPSLKITEQITSPADLEEASISRITSASKLDESSPCFIMCCIENGTVTIKLGNADEKVFYPIATEFEGTILCAAWMKDQYILLGSAEGYLYAFDIGRRQKTWDLKTASSITTIAIGQRNSTTNSVFVGMADGTLSLIMDLTGESVPQDVFSLRLGFTAISPIVVIEDQVWCACGCIVEIFDVITFDHVRKITVSENPLDNITCLAACSYGVWVATVGKTSLKLWSTNTFEPISTCDIGKYQQSTNSDNSNEPENLDRVTAVLANDTNVFVGTGSGMVLIYKILKWKNKALPPAGKKRFLMRQSATLGRSYASLGRSSLSLFEAIKKENDGSDIDNSIPADKIEDEHGRLDSQDSGIGSLGSEVTDQMSKRPSVESPPPNVPRMKNSSLTTLNLLLTSRTQVTESPIRAFLQIKTRKDTSILSFSQRIKEGDAVLKWEQTNKSGSRWTNKPMLELCPKNSAPILPPYLRSAVLRKMSSVN